MIVGRGWNLRGRSWPNNLVLAGGAGAAALGFATQQLRWSVSFLCRQPRRRARCEAIEAANDLQSALLAQLVEHFHGKEGVNGSSPLEGFLEGRMVGPFAPA